MRRSRADGARRGLTIGEALAAGLPVVTTNVGAEGMSLEHGTTALIADSVPAFAARGGGATLF